MQKKIKNINTLLFSFIVHGLLIASFFAMSIFQYQKKQKEVTIIEIGGIGGEIVDHQEPDENTPEPPDEPEPDEPEEVIPPQPPVTPPPPSPNKPVEEGLKDSKSQHEINAEREKQKAIEEAKKKAAADRKKREEEKKKKEAADRKKREEAARKKLDEQKRKKEVAERKKKREEEMRRRLNESKTLKNTTSSQPSHNNNSNIEQQLKNAANSGQKSSGGRGGNQNTNTTGGRGQYSVSGYTSLLSTHSYNYWSEDKPTRSELGGRAPKVDVSVTIRKNGTISTANIVSRSGIQAMDSRVEKVVAKIRRLKLPPFSQYNIDRERLVIVVTLEVE